MPNFERLEGRWEELAYWQKGAIIGGGLHIGIVLLIALAAFIFVPRTRPPGGSMGTVIGGLLFILYGLIQFIPGRIAFLITGMDLALPGPKLWIWFLYIIYQTLFYSLVGVGIAEVVKRLRRQNG